MRSVSSTSDHAGFPAPRNTNLGFKGWLFNLKEKVICQAAKLPQPGESLDGSKLFREFPETFADLNGLPTNAALFTAPKATLFSCSCPQREGQRP